MKTKMKMILLKLILRSNTNNHSAVVSIAASAALSAFCLILAFADTVAKPSSNKRAGLQVPARANTQAPAKPAKPMLPTEFESDRKPSVVTKGNCLIQGGTVVTVTKGTLPATDVLVQNGKIVGIGKNLTAPAGTTIIDARGRFVTPGLIDAHSHIASDSTNEGSDSITAEVRIQDVLSPDSLSVWYGLSNGVTTSLVLHGSANAIGGQSLVIKMKYKRPADELLIPDAPRMVKFALGENVKQSFRFPGQTSRYPSTRMGVETVYRRAFAEAKEYAKEWDAYEKAKATDSSALAPRKDLRLEALSDILKQKIWVQCHCYRADEMLMMVRLSQEFGFKIGALQHALEAYKIAPELAAAHIPISTFADAWGYKVEAYDAIPYNAALCTRAGVIASVNSDNGSGSYRLNLEAAKEMKFGGLTEEEAWKLITINPAIQLGIDRRTGSLEVGKDADIGIWQGHPFTASSKCQFSLVEGEVFFQRRDAWGVDKTAVSKSELVVSTVDPLKALLPGASQSYVITGATLHPISGPAIPDGTLVMQNGKILSVGVRAQAPAGAITVNAKGLHVYPGMIDANSVLGLNEIDQVNSTLDSSEGGQFQPDVLASVAIHADSVHIPITRCDGVTTTMTTPNSGGLIAGQGTVIDLDGWTREEMTILPKAALIVNFPGGVGINSLFETEEVLKPARDAQKNQIKSLKEFFDKVKLYFAARKQSPDSTVVDAKLEAMAPYMEGKLPVVFRVGTENGIRRAVKFAGEYGLKTVIQSDAEALKVADLLAEKNIPVFYALTMQNSLNESRPTNQYSPYDSEFTAPASLIKAGVKVCFASNDAATAKNLPTQAGILTGFGMTPEGVLKSLTLDAANVLGIADKLGSLEPGKIANLIITDGDPTEFSTRIRNLFIGGKPVSLENRHTQFYKLFRQRLGKL